MKYTEKQKKNIIKAVREEAKLWNEASKRGAFKNLKSDIEKEKNNMLKLDEHLQYQINHFHGGYFDFIYKINEVLEYNNIKESFYNDAVKVIKDKVVRPNDTEKTLKEKENNKNYELYKIAFNMVTLINKKNKELGEHLKKVLSVIICETSTIIKNYNPSSSC